jgi:hypothetical protein
VAKPKSILGLGAKLSDPRVVDADFRSDRTLLEHEIVLWDPEEVLEGYRAPTRYKNAACLDDDASVAFRADLARRRNEIDALLELGRLLVVLIPAPARWFISTGEERNEGTAAKPRIRRIVTEMNTGEVLPLRMSLVRAKGDSMRLAAGPPFSSFWRAVGDQFAFHAYLQEPVGTTLLTLEGTDHPTAALVATGGGTVLFLPQIVYYEPSENDIDADEDDEDYDDKWYEAYDRISAENHKRLVDALLELDAALVGGDETTLPGWVEAYRLSGESSASDKVASAQTAVANARQELEAAVADLALTQQRKALIASTGKPLERQVHAALAELGCEVEEGEPGRTDRIIRWGNRTAVLEVKGLTKSAKEADAAQLEKWVSEYTIAHGKTPKGILAVSAWREIPLAERTQPTFPHQMLRYAESREHCLIDTGQILAGIETCTTKAAKNAFLRQMFRTVGVFEGYPWNTALTYTVTEVAEADSG